ncbi:hypothetical protein GQ42DRAFT_160665 [Ramicandelaber brevisporus]|nr:hypothetical protein GQ42DRAFT_160665 [Ramicandelaber brevisporus]
MQPQEDSTSNSNSNSSSRSARGGFGRGGHRPSPLATDSRDGSQQRGGQSGYDRSQSRSRSVGRSVLGGLVRPNQIPPPPSVATTTTARDSTRDGENDEDDADDGEEDEEDDGIDDPEAAAFPPVVLDIKCPFGDCSSKQGDDDTSAVLLTTPNQLISHLHSVHAVQFINLHHMVFVLQSYLNAWATRITQHNSDWIAAGATQPASQPDATDAMASLSLSGPFVSVNPDLCPDDKTLREDLCTAKLKQILDLQNAERHSSALEPHDCLFCSITCPDRTHLFRHMFDDHGFNIGLSDNLVFVDEFLSILRSKLTDKRCCVFCEKAFSTATVLRKHMRKKRHFKISGHNREYDRFYVANYLEPGISWEERARENEALVDDYDNELRTPVTIASNGSMLSLVGYGGGDDAEWDDWVEDDDGLGPSQCLFGDANAPSTEAIIEHMKTEHKFDLPALRKENKLNFHKTVVLINYMRRQTALNTCYLCGTEVADNKALIEHLEEKRCYQKLPAKENELWSDLHNLHPVIADDPLLMCWMDDDDEEENDTN